MGDLTEQEIAAVKRRLSRSGRPRRELTAIEWQVAKRLAEGASLLEVALERGRSRNTIATQRRRIYRELGLAGEGRALRRQLMALFGNPDGKVPTHDRGLLPEERASVLLMRASGAQLKAVAAAHSCSVPTVWKICKAEKARRTA
jgi:DNA-binding CsgD family transcriptional regulator